MESEKQKKQKQKQKKTGGSWKKMYIDFIFVSSFHSRRPLNWEEKTRHPK